MAQIFKRAGIWHYDFRWRNKRYQGSTFTSDRVKAELYQAKVMEDAGRDAGTWKRKEATEPGVYVLLSPNTGLVKIGCSGNMSQRIAQHIDMNADGLELLAKIPAIEYLDAERVFHQFLAPYRHKGEWFKVTGRHIEAAILYWATGHPFLDSNKAVKASNRKDEAEGKLSQEEIHEATKLVAKREKAPVVYFDVSDLSSPVLFSSPEVSS